MSILLSFIFPPPPSLYLGAMSLVSFASLTHAGFLEAKGKHLEYSKFWNVDSGEKSNVIEISSRKGMLAIYTPAFLASLASFGLSVVAEDPRSLLASSALTIHFFKRVVEVLCVHRYSGAMNLDVAIPISLSYFFAAVNMIYSQILTQGIPDPALDLKYIGIFMFFVGIGGNFYHHLILSKLRETGDSEYKIPKGGLFSLVICPHYLFEIIGFIGVSFISQTVYSFSYTLGTIFFLMGRSYATKNWYLSKFPNFPQEVKALIPSLF